MTESNGAGEGTRTLDTKLGKLLLYQLSYARVLVASLQHHRPGTTFSWKIFTNGPFGESK